MKKLFLTLALLFTFVSPSFAVYEICVLDYQGNMEEMCHDYREDYVDHFEAIKGIDGYYIKMVTQKGEYDLTYFDKYIEPLYWQYKNLMLEQIKYENKGMSPYTYWDKYWKIAEFKYYYKVDKRPYEYEE